MENGLIYHYTTIEAIDKIILDTDDNEKKICLLASNYEYVNDPYEISHGFQTICKYLSQVENDLNIDFEYRFADKICHNIQNVKELTIFSSQSNSSIYITCFSGNKDSLPMWDMYGNKGNGICMGFHWAPCLIKPYRLRKVIYDNNKSDIIDLLKHYYDWNKDNLKEIVKKGDLKTIYSALFRYIGAYIKHHKYSYEEEYRYVIDKELTTKSSTEKIKFRVKNGNLIPYCEIFLPSYTLEQIIIGPTNNFYRSENALRMFLDSRNLRTVKILKSDIPFTN